MKLTHAPIVVSNQDQALKFFTEQLGFEKRADYQKPGKPRWLTVAPKGQDTEFILVEGRQKVERRLPPDAGTGGYQWAFTTTDCQQDYEILKARGVDFTGAPDKRAWGTSAYFRDADGNQFALVQPSGLTKFFSALGRLKR